MTRNALTLIKTGGLILFILIIVGYSVYQARNLIFGPDIHVVSPIDGETYTDGLVHVKGTVSNATRFTIDDNPVFTDTDGSFDESLLLLPGYNIITINAADRFGKRKEVTIQVIYKENIAPITSPSSPTPKEPSSKSSGTQSTSTGASPGQASTTATSTNQ